MIHGSIPRCLKCRYITGPRDGRGIPPSLPRNHQNAFRDSEQNVNFAVGLRYPTRPDRTHLKVHSTLLSSNCSIPITVTNHPRTPSLLSGTRHLLCLPYLPRCSSTFSTSDGSSSISPSFSASLTATSSRNSTSSIP